MIPWPFRRAPAPSPRPANQAVPPGTPPPLLTSRTRHWPVLAAELADHMVDVWHQHPAERWTLRLQISTRLLPDALATGATRPELLRLAQWLHPRGVVLHVSVPAAAIPEHSARLLRRTPGPPAAS